MASTKCSKGTTDRDIQGTLPPTSVRGKQILTCFCTYMCDNDETDNWSLTGRNLLPSMFWRLVKARRWSFLVPIRLIWYRIQYIDPGNNCQSKNNLIPSQINFDRTYRSQLKINLTLSNWMPCSFTLLTKYLHSLLCFHRCLSIHRGGRVSLVLMFLLGGGGRAGQGIQRVGYRGVGYLGGRASGVGYPRGRVYPG